MLFIVPLRRIACEVGTFLLGRTGIRVGKDSLGLALHAPASLFSRRSELSFVLRLDPNGFLRHCQALLPTSLALLGFDRTSRP